jgi:hypothetical protein
MAQLKTARVSSEDNAHSFRHRRVWLYMVDGRNSDDLAILDSQGFDTWRGNPNTKAGDLILMYRSAPFSDIAYVFVAGSNAWRTVVTRQWPWRYAVEISDGFRLPRVIKLQHLKDDPALSHWTFLRHQRGAVARRADLIEQGVWPGLKRLLEEYAPALPEHFRGAWTGRGRRQSVFLSYASDDKRKAQNLYYALARNGLDVWLDRHELQPAKDWDQEIQRAIKSCKAFIVCISKAWLERDEQSYAKKEFSLAMAEVDRRPNQQYLFPLLIENVRVPDALRIQAAALKGHTRLDKVQDFARIVRNALFRRHVATRS